MTPQNISDDDVIRKAEEIIADMGIPETTMSDMGFVIIGAEAIRRLIEEGEE